MHVRSLLLVLCLSLSASVVLAVEKNGFDLSEATIPVEEIYHGGPPRDGIPAIDAPRFVKAGKAGKAEFLAPMDRVLGLFHQGEAKAYPIKILNWHEVVNDEVGRTKVVITFCPLCGSGVAFSAAVAGEARRFGVSGLLYNSDVLLYDRESESLWSQLMAQAIAGPLAGHRLVILPLEHTTWRDWRRQYPNTRVLSTDTGHQRDYERDPYAGYVNDRGIMFSVQNLDPRYHPKEQVLGLEFDGQFKAYPFAELSKHPGEVKERFAGQEIRIVFDAENLSAIATTASGERLPAVTSFWFAWFAFHPDTEVFTSPPNN